MTIFEDAQARLHRYFAGGWSEIYDGAPIAQDATLSVADITLSVALNSQLDTRNKIWHVWQGRTGVEATLAKISSTIGLESDNVPWEDLHEVFEVFCGIKYAKEAVVTKILHKKRPALIPVYDRFIWEHFQSSIDNRLWRSGGAPFLVEYLKHFRQELIVHYTIIQDLCAHVAECNWPITPVRMLEVLIWMEYESTGYYRSTLSLAP